MISENTLHFATQPTGIFNHLWVFSQARHSGALKLMEDIAADCFDEGPRPPCPRYGDVNVMALKVVEQGSRHDLSIALDPHAGKRGTQGKAKLLGDEPGNPLVTYDQVTIPAVVCVVSMDTSSTSIGAGDPLVT